MTHTITRAPWRSRALGHGCRATAAVLAGTLGFGALTALPAFADSGTWLNGGTNGETISVADAVIAGDAIRLEGTGWLDNEDDSDADGSWIAIKLGAAAGVEPALLTTEPAAGKFVFPGAESGTAAIWYGIVADDDGDFSVEIPFPTASNTSPALATEWAPGTTHHLQLLTGSMKPGGDRARSAYVTFTISADTLTVTASAGGRGAPAGQVTITVAAGAGTFAANEALTATVDGESVAWNTGGTASGTGALTSTNMVFAPGTLRAGSHTVEVTGATSGVRSRTVKVLPTAAYSSLAQGSSGTLTLSNLPAGSSVTEVAFDGADVEFSGLPASETDGVATVPYAIADDSALGNFPVTVKLADPTETFTLANQKISPDATVFGEDGFTIVSTNEGIFQGLYQSAYSSTENALFATAAAGTGANEDGYLYKLDPQTLAVLASAHPKELTVGGETGKAPYGVGVDDVNGTVWVTNTRTNTVAVYAADDLELLKQFPTGTISHSRDAIYDPASDRVFVSSASEGSNGNGYISVFNAKTYEKIDDIQTGARADYSPMSLAVDDGTLVSPSLTTNKVVKVDTASLEFEFVEVAGINVGGRGASGIAFDAAADRLYVASQNSDEVVIASAATGETIKEVSTGAGALNVALEPVNGLLYVTNFGGSTVTVLDLDGNKVANLPIARANHASVDGLGNAYVVDKAAGNKVWRISPKPAPEPEPELELAAPEISGDLNVGSELTATVPGDLPEGTTLRYQWFANGSRIAGATGATLTLAKAQAGKAISVGVTAVLGDQSGSEVSEDTAKVAGILIPITGQPTITGTPQVGKKLTANGAPVTTPTAKTSRSYQWYADGVAIAKATKSTHTLTAAQVGKEITVTVVLKRSGHATTYSDPSTATTQVAPATFSNTRLPKITGTLKVGKTLTATGAKWSTSSVKVRYNWYATTDGVTSLIQHSTSNKLKLTTADRGAVISVELVATKAGYTPVTTNPVSTTGAVR